MALERQSIEKKDFPIGRRGYDPEAVDAHLSSLAEEVEELKRSAAAPDRDACVGGQRAGPRDRRGRGDQRRGDPAPGRGGGSRNPGRGERRGTEHPRAGDRAGARLRRQGVGVDGDDAPAARRDGERAERPDRIAADRLQPAERRSPAARGQPDRGAGRRRPTSAVRARGRRVRRRCARAAGRAGRSCAGELVDEVDRYDGAERDRGSRSRDRRTTESRPSRAARAAPAAAERPRATVPTTPRAPA